MAKLILIEQHFFAERRQFSEQIKNFKHWEFN